MTISLEIVISEACQSKNKWKSSVMEEDFSSWLHRKLKYKIVVKLGLCSMYGCMDTTT